MQDTNNSADNSRKEEEKDEEEEISILIEKADKYFIALKNLFTAKMLRLV